MTVKSGLTCWKFRPAPASHHFFIGMRQLVYLLVTLASVVMGSYIAKLQELYNQAGGISFPPG